MTNKCTLIFMDPTFRPNSVRPVTSAVCIQRFRSESTEPKTFACVDRRFHVWFLRGIGIYGRGHSRGKRSNPVLLCPDGAVSPHSFDPGCRNWGQEISTCTWQTIRQRVAKSIDNCVKPQSGSVALAARGMAYENEYIARFSIVRFLPSGHNATGM